MFHKNLHIAISIAAFATATLFAHAQSAPEFFVTWRAMGYVSPSYQGKILPTAGTPIEIGFELVDGGKIADISKSTVNVILNGKKVSSGLGLKTAVVATKPLIMTGGAEIKIVVDKYKGATAETFFTIPLARPEVVIRSPYPGNVVSPGNSSFDALFYYWNVATPDRLTLAWSVNNEKAGGTGAGSGLTVTLPAASAGSALQLGVSAKNLDNEFEFADDSANLAVVK